jgi:hypothetical protein
MATLDSGQKHFFSEKFALFACFSNGTAWRKTRPVTPKDEAKGANSSAFHQESVYAQNVL